MFINPKHLSLCVVVRLLQVDGRQQLLATELLRLREKKKETERELRTSSSPEASAVSDASLTKFLNNFQLLLFLHDQNQTTKEQTPLNLQ